MSFTGWGGSRKPGTSAVGRIRGARDTRLTVQSGGEMAYARILFNQTDHSASSIEVGLDSLDDPAVLEPLVQGAYSLWRLAVEDAEDEP